MASTHPADYSGTSGQPITTTATGGGGTTTPPAGPTQAQKDALAVIRSVLNQYGLGALADWAWSEIVAGASEAQVLLDLQQQQAFKDAFPEIAKMQQNGMTPLSPGEIITYRTQAAQMMRAAGLPEGFWDQPTDFANLIVNNVSLNELTDRINLARAATYEVPQDVRDELARYGITGGDLAANFLDPTVAEPLLKQKFLAAQIGGAATRTGYGSVMGDNEYLASLGVGADQAQAGFTNLAGQKELFGILPGEQTTGVSREEQLAAQFAGDSDAQRKILRKAETREAEFAGGGGFTSSRDGLAGIGASRSA